MLIRYEMTHSELTELVRQTYVEVAYDSYSIPEQEMTMSRVAVLTGLTRKEVVRIRALLENSEEVIRDAPNRAQRVVHGWLSDPEFLDDDKLPKILPVKGPTGSFVQLVKRYSGDISFGAVLEELNFVGVTNQPDKKSVQLINKAYIPRQDEIEQVRILTMCIADLFNTTLHNIESTDEEKRFQRQVVYHKVKSVVAEKFKNISAKQAEKLINGLNDVLAAENQSARTEVNNGGNSSDEPDKRIGFGLYYFEEPVGKGKGNDNEK